MPSRQQLRATFEEIPEAYGLARPAYPEAIFDDLASLAKLSRGARILEMGCGTGQATAPLAERGFRITCVELGKRLAAVARRELASFPAVQVVNADFETWEPEDKDFDAVVAFSAFHWLDPELRFGGAARLLRPGGALAVVATKHVLPADGDPFFAEVQADYDAVVPSEENRPPPDPATVPDLGAEIEASGLFRNHVGRRYAWEVTYTADEYIALLETYSGHRSIESEQRGRLYELIRHRIDAQPGGTVRKTYLATLDVAARR